MTNRDTRALLVVEHLNRALADRYHVQRELGHGGMATVYLAADLRQHRPVAIKVLKPGLAIELGPERFLREITTTAKLHHPHILPLYESGEADGFLFYVMPFIGGESVRDRIDREKQLPIDEALQITREVADALRYAHANGVIHRDIKPANILLESGHAMVADFGISRTLSEAGTQRITRSGMSVGTPTYMSPEQAAGEPDLDGRTDLYALACVLFEMLAGQPPFTGATAEALVRQHLITDPPLVTNFRRAVPATVTAALQRALAKAPADRFSQLTHFADALDGGSPTGTRALPPRPTGPDQSAGRRRWFALLAAVVVVAAGIAGAVLLRHRGSGSHIGRLAVLPLANLMADSGQDYFVDGMHEELLSQLGRIPTVDVLSRTSVQRYRGSRESVGQIAAELKVDALVEGSVFRSGDSVRITAELVQANPEKQLWSASYDGALGEALGLQRRVAGAIAAAIGTTLVGSAPRGASVKRIDPAAQEAYIKGRIDLRTRTFAGMDRAVTELSSATTIQPDFAEAYGGLAEAEFLRTNYRIPEWSAEQIRAGKQRAQDAADKALALDPTQPGALSTLGVLSGMDLDWNGAESRLRRAIALNPSSAQAWTFLGDVLDLRGRSTEAVAARLHAQRLDPFAPVMNRDVGLSMMAAGRYAEALPYLRTALEIQPGVALSSKSLVVCLIQLKRYDEAADEEARILFGLGADSAVVGHFRSTIAARGWPGALSWLIDLTRRDLPLATGDPAADVLAIPSLSRAAALAYLGRDNDAQDALDRTMADPGTAGIRMFELNADPWLHALRGQPRFTALLKRYRLAP